LRQVPRWLGEDHYNGPPQTTAGKLRYPFRPSFASPVLSGDGGTVLFDAQQPAPPLAVRYGEVVLEGRDLATGAQLDPRDASTGALLDRPCSSYGASLSSDGTKMAYEISAGNRTYAKRYGNVVVAVADMVSGGVRVVAGGQDGARVETAYDPALSDDGNVVAYESVIADPMSPSANWATRVRVRDLREASAPATMVPRAGAYDATVSGDGRVVAFTSYSHEHLQVFAYDRRTRKVTLVSRIGAGAGRASEAWEPSLSRNGRRIAFTATRKAGGRARVYVRDLRERTSRGISAASRGFAHEPSISSDGRRVAYAELLSSGGRSPSGRPVQRLLLRDLAGGKERGVSDPVGGASWSGQPQLSSDGQRVAYTTDAGVVAGGGPGGLRVVVADLVAGTFTTASPPAPMGSFDTAPGLNPGAARLCALAPPAW
jgi:Tol biopolymer transport system component